MIRAVDGPLATVRGLPPEEIDYAHDSHALKSMWLAVRVSLRSVVERVSLADLASNELPAEIERLIDLPEAWLAR